ncbi:FAD/NAD(P)-binding domain-containing protein [Punctularia strigosozonata HHB-11173 SS5]|uniref:FAD/NAD(P)-binding domain-containing protein n=1 Tax=Punctularia strigosozonata (strain HHB-11173) TaxID=741275 RepID=UPI0004416D5D|nr:FAD/NAD(P)-binding domain-containing protein [Punctularia strigosozonata HHB-11173 SS5]EIN13948.1 FAD/NAD(P)-binding domain-containing protein [Punctularia strigosozonata HHB-11173 SS5]
MSKQSIVVVGGGGAGADIARRLSAKLDITKHSLTLVTSRPFSVFLPAQLRTVVSDRGNLEKTSFIPYDKLFINNNGTVKVGKVSAVEPNTGAKGGSIVLENGEKIHYDILVLAPGSVWEGPLAYPDDPEQIKEHLAFWRSKFAESNHVVLAGGGAVGVELAGEIKDVWPKKKVTIVQGSEELLNPTYPRKYRAFIEKQIRARNIDIVFGDFIDEIPAVGSTTITTRNGKTFEDVLVVPTRGGRPNTAFLASSLGNQVLNEQGQVKVRPSLQLSAYDDVFAAGDIIDWKEQKQLAKYPVHAGVVAANILSILSGQSPTKVYKGTFELIVLTNGANGGAGYFDVLWGIVLGNWFAKLVKSKGLMIDMKRKELGL